MQVELLLPRNRIINDLIRYPTAQILQTQTFLQRFIHVITRFVDQEFPIRPFWEILADVTYWDQNDESILSSRCSTGRSKNGKMEEEEEEVSLEQHEERAGGLEGKR